MQTTIYCPVCNKIARIRKSRRLEPEGDDDNIVEKTYYYLYCENCLLHAKSGSNEYIAIKLWKEGILDSIYLRWEIDGINLTLDELKYIYSHIIERRNREKLSCV